MGDATDTRRNEGSHDLGKQSKELMQNAAQEAIDRVNSAGAKGMYEFGKTIDRAADFVEKKGNAVVDQGKVPLTSDQVNAVASPLHDAARYLQQNDPRSAVADIDRSIQRHPYRALAVGLGIGWVIGRFASRR